MNYLVLGDGNFSFSLSLCKKVLGPDASECAGKVVTTSLESMERVLQRPDAENILRQLRDYRGVVVVHGVDATELHSCEILSSLDLVFDVVVFNFPHTGGKSKIQENRTLLKNFFVSLSCSSLMPSGSGRVWVSLCRGQGGTPGDCPHRGYQNTWKVVEMAAEGHFVLDRVEPFSLSGYPEYTPTGYRGESDKGFGIDGALKHIFRSPSPSQPSLHPPHYHHDISFWWTSKDGAEFQQDALQEAVERTCEGCVQGVELVEVYKPHPASERVGYCYRLTYWSSWDAVSPTRAASLQLLLRKTLQTQHQQLELR